MRILSYKLFLEELVGTKPISNYDNYIKDMEHSMQDKMFFINNMDFDVIVDFGCANGTFLSKLESIKPNVKIIGYDLDDSMLNKAKSILNEDAILTNNWNIVIEEVKKYKKPLLNLSSVIHEVYSYSHSSVIKKFWEKQVFGGNFKYITIRDMIPSVQIHKNEVNKFVDDVKKVKELADPFYLESFEKEWGPISENYRTLCHFLLKYKYTDNWEREVRENYLPVSLETLKKKIPGKYKIIFEEDFIVPFIQNEIYKDFGIKLTHSTHVKMIIENNNFDNK
jgi:23S rRNA U2552 (ribose-2'-O)-methylase RlmE/FtsJ